MFGLGFATVLTTLLLGVAPADAEQVPYTDPQSSGSLTLCDAQGHEIRSGSIRTQPLAPLIVGSTAVPPDYAKGGTAILLAYQPRSGLGAGQWSGELMTGSARFTTPLHPAVVGLPDDLSLAAFVTDFPTQWNSLVQLRVYLGAPGKPVYKQRYDTADLKVDGESWTLVRGGGGSCGAGRAVAVADILGVASTSAPTSAATTSTATTTIPSPRGRAVALPTTSSTTRPVGDASSARGVGGGYVLPLVGGGLVVLVVAGISLLVRRRQATS